MYEDINKNNDTSESGVSTSSDASSIDYEMLEKSFYNALYKYYGFNNTKSGFVSSSLESSDLVDFATSTDSNYYTVSYVSSPSSVAEQELGYILDIRNILLIFLFIYFIISIYGKLKNTIVSYYERS